MKNQVDSALLNIAGVTVDKILDILAEMTRAATSNPLLGIVVGVSSADMLNRAGLLSNEARNIIWVSIGAIEAVQSAGSILTDLIPFKNASNDLLPTATTIVFGGQAKDVSIHAPV